MNEVEDDTSTQESSRFDQLSKKLDELQECVASMSVDNTPEAGDKVVTVIIVGLFGHFARDCLKGRGHARGGWNNARGWGQNSRGSGRRARKPFSQNLNF